MRLNIFLKLFIYSEPVAQPENPRRSIPPGKPYACLHWEGKQTISLQSYYVYLVTMSDIFQRRYYIIDGSCTKSNLCFKIHHLNLDSLQHNDAVVKWLSSRNHTTWAVNFAKIEAMGNHLIKIHFPRRNSELWLLFLGLSSLCFTASSYQHRTHNA